MDAPETIAMRLARDFAAKTALARRGIETLTRGVAKPRHCTAGQTSSGTRPDTTAPAELARRTWFLLTIKLLVAETMAAVGGRPSVAAQLARSDDPRRLHEEIEAVERGPLLGPLHGDGDVGDPWAWYLDAWSNEIAGAVRDLAARLAEYPRAMIVAAAGGGHDLFKPLYQAVFPRAARHALGEYYTPDWLAEHVLDQVGYPGRRGGRLLDPACGSGTFLMAAIRRLRADGEAEKGTVPMCRASHEGGQSPFPPSGGKEQIARRILDGVVGLELNPLAALAARANYLLAIADLLPGSATIEIPVFRCDAILDGAESDGPAGQGTVPFKVSFDFVVGNPPWIAWDNLPGPYRQATKPLWERYGLFSLSANEARHGGGKKDLAMLMLYRGADRYLAPGGRLGMVITQSLLQTKAGDGFRRFRLGAEGDWLRVDRVDDLTALRPFPGAASRTATIVLTKGARTEYPVPYVKWTPVEKGDRVPPGCHSPPRGTVPFFQVCRARPIDPGRPGSPWLILPAEEAGGRTFPPDATGGLGEEKGDCPHLPERPEGCLAQMGTVPFFRAGASDYQAHLGANSGGANAVYWLRVLERSTDGDGGVVVENLAAKAKHGVAAVRQTIEPDLLYPLVRWGDVGRWSARPSAHILLAQDVDTRTGIAEEVMRREYPRTYRYLQQFEPLLSRRAAYRRYQGQKPFYSMYNVGPYTVAPIKVVWRRMERVIRAAVVEAVDDPLLGRRPLVPQETCVLVACGSADEAHYLCAVLNSARAGALVAAHSVVGGKGFGSPGMLEYLGLRRFAADDPRHAALAACSRRAHELSGGAEILPSPSGRGAGGEGLRGQACYLQVPESELAAIEHEIDRLAAEL
jgi:hypothetical protein